MVRACAGASGFKSRLLQPMTPTLSRLLLAVCGLHLLLCAPHGNPPNPRGALKDGLPDELVVDIATVLDMDLDKTPGPAQAGQQAHQAQDAHVGSADLAGMRTTTDGLVDKDAMENGRSRGDDHDGDDHDRKVLVTRAELQQLDLDDLHSSHPYFGALQEVRKDFAQMVEALRRKLNLDDGAFKGKQGGCVYYCQHYIIVHACLWCVYASACMRAWCALLAAR